MKVIMFSYGTRPSTVQVLKSIKNALKGTKMSALLSLPEIEILHAEKKAV